LWHNINLREHRGMLLVMPLHFDQSSTDLPGINDAASIALGDSEAHKRYPTPR